MANKITNTQNYTNIANAIREKNGTNNTYTPAQMSQAIRDIPSGGGGVASLQNCDYFLNSARYNDANMRAMVQAPTSARALFNKIEVASPSELQTLFERGRSVDISNCNDISYFYNQIIVNSLFDDARITYQPFPAQWRPLALKTPCKFGGVACSRWIAHPLHFCGGGTISGTVLLPGFKYVRLEPLTAAEAQEYTGGAAFLPFLSLNLTLFGNSGHVNDLSYAFFRMIGDSPVLFDDSDGFFPGDTELEAYRNNLGGNMWDGVRIVIDLSYLNGSNNGLTQGGWINKSVITNMCNSIVRAMRNDEASDIYKWVVVILGEKGMYNTSQGWTTTEINNQYCRDFSANNIEIYGGVTERSASVSSQYGQVFYPQQNDVRRYICGTTDATPASLATATGRNATIAVPQYRKNVAYGQDNASIITPYYTKAFNNQKQICEI